MKNLGLSVVLGIATLASACENAGPQGAAETGTVEEALTSTVWHANWNGAAADAYAYGPTSMTEVYAFENKSAGNRSAYLNVFGWGYDPNSQVCETDQWCWTDDSGNSVCEDYTYCYYSSYYYVFGWGQIPSADFRVDGKVKGAHLNTDLSKDPNMTVTQCSSASGWTCTNVTSGTIDVTWKANGFYSGSYNGTQSVTYGSYSARSTGQSSSASASTTGTVLGNAVTGGGEIEQSQNNTISRDIVH